MGILGRNADADAKAGMMFCCLLLSTLFFSSCAFDDDSKYFPRTLASFFLVKDTATSELSIFKRGEQSSNWPWNTQCNVPSAGLSCLQLDTRGLFLSDVQARKILLTDPGTGALIRDWSCGDFVPHYFSAGNKYILISDTIHSKSVFTSYKKEKNYEKDFAPDPPGASIYNAGKFYLIKGCCSVSVISEDALTEIATYTTTDTFEALAKDSYFNIQILGRGSSGFMAYGIDPNTNLITQGNHVDYHQSELTPWNRIVYGREYLQNISLKDSTLNVPAFPHPADAFTCDFFNSILYYQWGDSLFRYDLVSKTGEPVWSLDGKNLVRGFHWIGSGE